MFGRMRGQPTVPGASKRRPSSSPRQIPGSGPLICTSAPTGRSTSSIIIATLLSIRSGWPQTLTTPGIYITDRTAAESRSEEHTSELQSHHDLVCRLLLEKKKKKKKKKKNKITN